MRLCSDQDPETNTNYAAKAPLNMGHYWVSLAPIQSMDPENGSIVFAEHGSIVFAEDNARELTEDRS